MSRANAGWSRLRAKRSSLLTVMPYDYPVDRQTSTILCSFPIRPQDVEHEGDQEHACREEREHGKVVGTEADRPHEGECTAKEAPRQLNLKWRRRAGGAGHKGPW